MQPTIFLVDDEMAILKSVKRSLREMDVDILIFNSPIDALKHCKDCGCPDLMISDQRMPLLLGTDLIAQVKSINKNTQCFLMSAYHDFDEVAKAFNLSNIDRYISKPWNNKELIQHIEEALLINNDNKQPQITLPKFDQVNIIAKSDAMQKVFSQVKKAASSNVPIFVHGETGTGKELIAKSCHSFSPRKDNKFVAFNCANFSDTLMESQLFGHKKGAFTGAVSDQAGIFSTAEKGTIFLDEVTCIPMPLQAKLLRVIQEREYSPVGSHNVFKFDVQIVSASSTSLSQAVMEGEFREDLYYRLNVIHISIPALRDREQDILLISQYYLSKFSQAEGKKFVGFDQSAAQLIANYEWPGNVRQLENLIHSLVILNDGEYISYSLLKDSLEKDSIYARNSHLNNKPNQHSNNQMDQDPHSFSNKNNDQLPQSNNLENMQPEEIKPLWKMEQDYIETIIDQCEGNVTKAASLLEISPSTIYRKQLSWQKNSQHL